MQEPQNRDDDIQVDIDEVLEPLRKFCEERNLDLVQQLDKAIDRHIKHRDKLDEQARKRREERDLSPLGFFSPTLQERADLELERLEERERARQFNAEFLKDLRIKDDGFDALSI